jgi:prepilin-type N-terminal cleavage/methylation domain-containing protein/prepilin-type processing-associated H-X9-DG protein
MEQHPRHGRRASAFTLVEVLVVIAIIGVLISLLLPAISMARQQANTIACAANLRGIMQAIMLYATDWNDAIPGDANTSGAVLLLPEYDNDNCPELIQTWDWISPVARELKIDFNGGPAPADRFDRFQRLVKNRAFRCPENNIIASSYTETGGPEFPTHTMNSYIMASGFHYLQNTTGENYAADGVGTTIARTEYNVPSSYGPRLSKIVNASRKICIADGARYSTTTSAPDTDFDYNGGFGGAFADVGAWSRYSYSWNRGKAPGNDAAGRVDPRIFAYRHGRRSPNGPADAYKFNAAFYDGHVELLGDLQGADPSLWLPSRTIIDSSGNEMYRDAHQRYCAGAGATMVLP